MLLYIILKNEIICNRQIMEEHQKQYEDKIDDTS